SRLAVSTPPSDPGALRAAPLGEELRVQLKRVRELLWSQGLREDRVYRARLYAGVAVDADLGIDVQLLRCFEVGIARLRMDAVDRTDLDAGVVLDAATGDYVGHGRSDSLRVVTQRVVGNPYA